MRHANRALVSHLFAPARCVPGCASALLLRPKSNNAKVVATVIEHYRGKKIQVFKKKRRKGYARRHGHRQEHTTLRIDEVQYTGADE